MVQSWQLATGAVWSDALSLIVGVVILGAAISFLARWLRSTWPDGPDAEQLRREMLDECFAKGEMSREECEGGCQGLGHPGERRLPPRSAPYDPEA